MTEHAAFGGGARRYVLRGAGFGGPRRPWLFNAVLAMAAFGVTIATAGTTLGITANAEAPTEARATADVSSFRLARPVVLREVRPPASSQPVQIDRTYPFIWPALGPITSYMGNDHPLGIDIGLDPGLDVEVRAAAGGIVTFAGGSNFESYGYYVVIDHGSGITSLYAHLATPIVAAGQPVAQGQPIGIGGSTGKSNGKHLHFEVRLNDATLDPLDFMPQDNRDSELLVIDCMTTGFVLDAGSSVEFNFIDALLPGGVITRVELVKANPDDTQPRLTTRTSTQTTVRLDSALDLAGPAADHNYNLIVSVDEQGESRDLDCELTLRTSVGVPAYYVPWVAATDAPEPAPVQESQQPMVEATGVEAPPTEAPPVEERTLEPTPTLAIPTNVPLLGGVLPTVTPEPVSTPEPLVPIGEATDTSVEILPTETSVPVADPILN